MTYPKIRSCLKCGNDDMAVYGYGESQPLNWHVECDDCQYLGPCGNKLQAIRAHNSRAALSPATRVYRCGERPSGSFCPACQHPRAPGYDAKRDGRYPARSCKVGLIPRYALTTPQDKQGED